MKQEVVTILQQGLPPRVAMLSESLREYYQVPPLSAEQFIVA